MSHQGLDAGLERRIIHQLRGLAGQGRTIVVVTHSIQTLEEYDRVAFLARGGRLAFYGPPRDAFGFFGPRITPPVYDALNDPSRPGSYWADRSASACSAGGAAAAGSAAGRRRRPASARSPSTYARLAPVRHPHRPLCRHHKKRCAQSQLLAGPGTPLSPFSSPFSSAPTLSARHRPLPTASTCR